MKIRFFLLVSLFTIFVFSQDNFLKTISGLNDLKIYCFLKTSDRGFAFCGSGNYLSVQKENEGESKSVMVFVKTDLKFNPILSKVFLSSGNISAYSLIETSKRGFLLCGERVADDNSTYGLVLNINKKGHVIWAKNIRGGEGITEVSLIDAKETDKGDFILLGNLKKSSGSNDYDIFLIGLSADGTLLWQKVYDSGKNDYSYSLLKNREGDFIISGTSFFVYDYNASLIKVDAGGVIKWQKFFGTNRDEFGYNICEGNDGGYLLVGESYKDDNSLGYIVRVDNFGGDVWQKFYAKADSIFNNNYFIFSKANNKHGFLLSGVSEKRSNYYESFFMKIDWSGKIIFQKKFDFSESSVIYSAKTIGKNIFVLGTTLISDEIKSFFAKTDEDGKILDCPYIKDNDLVSKNIENYGSGNLNLSIKDNLLFVEPFKRAINTLSASFQTETLCE